MKKQNFYKTSSTYLTGFILVFTAGILWSFGPVFVRYMVDSQEYVFQYLFFRGISIALVLLSYLFLKEGLLFYKNFFRIGISSILGGCFLSGAFIGFIYSITMTVAAVTLLMLAAMPFIAAIVGYLILGEILRKTTLISMVVAFIGVCIMIVNDSISSNALGAIIGFMSASCFALYTVTIRWKPETPKFTTVVLAGIICAIFSCIMLGFSFNSFYEMPIKNLYLSFLHGTIVGLGLILYSLGAKYLPAAELALLSLMEVVGGIFWVWIPIFGINEIPSIPIIIGGTIIISAVLFHGIGATRKRMPIIT